MKRTAIIFSLVAIATGSVMVNYAITAQTSDLNEPYSLEATVKSKAPADVQKEIVIENTLDEEIEVEVKEEEFKTYTETVIDLLEPVEDSRYTHKIHSRGINLVVGEKFDDWNYMGVEVTIEHTSPTTFTVISVEKSEDYIGFHCGC